MLLVMKDAFINSKIYNYLTDYYNSTITGMVPFPIQTAARHN